MAVKIYGFLISQPTRAVAWASKVKGLDYELVSTNPLAGEADNDEFAAMNPNKLVPVLKDGDFTLFEGAAILTYLAEKHGWTDLLPSDIRQRAKVNQYLHWHHTSVRKGTPQILISYISQANKNATPAQLEFIAKKGEIIGNFTGILEKILIGPFIAGADQPTIADFFAYCEFDQLEAMGVFDFAKYPKVHAWLARMKKIPFHDEFHQDINGFLASLDLKPVKA